MDELIKDKHRRDIQQANTERLLQLVDAPAEGQLREMDRFGRLAVMMGLGPYIGREYAHDLVYDLCRESLATKTPLIELLVAHPEIKRHVGRGELERMLDPANYLGQSGAMVDRVLAQMGRH
jgi:3-carboxy-cis,cis-muconate cycloisomerase